MGVRGLYHYCKKYLHNPNYDKKLRIGIDSSSLIYRFHGNFDKIYEFLEPILQNKLLFVLEGKAPEYKSEEIIIRKQAKEVSNNRLQLLKKAYEDPTNFEAKDIIMKRIMELEKDSFTITYDTIQEFKKFLRSKDLKYVKSTCEADTVLIDLYYANIIDTVLSNDMDYLVAGVKHMYVPRNNNIEELLLNDILEFEEINSEQFKEACILAGIDNDRIIVLDNIYQCISFIRHYGSIQSMVSYQPLLFTIPNEQYIINIKKRYYPNKDFRTYLKPEHKEIVYEFI